jgi:hypothetical protein
VQDTTPLRQWVEPLCQPAAEPARRQATTVTAAAPAASVAAATDASASTTPEPAASVTAATDVSGSTTPAPGSPRRPRRVRGLNPLGAADAALLTAVSRHEFLINGIRNRDLRRLLLGADVASADEQRHRSGQVTRQLRLLRAHGLIHKVPKTHRYLVSEKGRKTITALLAARNASTEQLTSNVA